MNDLKIKLLKTLYLWFFIAASLYGFNVAAQPIPLILENNAESITEKSENSIIVKDIAINELEDINVDNIGIVNENNKAYGFDLWQNANINNINMLLSNLGSNFKINAFYDIIKNLLTAQSNPPQSSKDFLYTRIKTLFDIGMTNDVLQLIEKAGLKNFSDSIKPEINNLYLQSSLIENTIVCDQTMLFADFDDIYNQKLAIICDLNNNKKEEALLKINILRDEKYKDEAFFSLVEYVAGASLVKPDMKSILASPFNLSVALNSEELIAKLPENFSMPWHYKLLLSNDRLPVLTRIKSAEKALSLNLINATTLEKIYLSAVFNKDELKKPLTTSEKLPPQMGRALLYQSAVGFKGDFENAEIIAKVFSLENNPNAIIANSFVYAPVINKMSFSKNLSAFFDCFAVIMAYSRDIFKINDVLDMKKILESQNSSLFFVLSTFLEIDSAHEFVSEKLKPLTCSSPDEMVFTKINTALKAKNFGEMLLLVISSLKDIESSKICPSSLERVLYALKDAGFEPEAKIIAYQILVENSILLNWPFK